MNNFMTFLLRNSHQYPDLTFGGRIPARDDDHTNKMARDLCSLCCAWFKILFLAVAGLECHGQRTQWHTDCTIEQILCTPNFAKMFLDCLKAQSLLEILNIYISTCLKQLVFLLSHGNTNLII